MLLRSQSQSNKPTIKSGSRFAAARYVSFVKDLFAI